MLEEGDYLTSAGILQREIGQSLEQYVWERFGGVRNPTEIHRAIARIPFSLAITTNYDRLLESAYPARPNVWTWRDPEALFSSIKHRRFAIVKIHGDVGNGPSLVLTKNQYRDLMHLNRAFNDTLTSLLSLRTFLFVGTSLRDHDLIQLMDSAKLTYGADFGPHYALTFSDEVDESLSRLLRDAYNLHCIICQEPDEPPADWKTEATCSFLKVLSGKVAQQSSVAIPISKLEHPVFSLRTSSDELCRFAIQNLAADHAQLAFVTEPTMPSLFGVAHATQVTQTAEKIGKPSGFPEHCRQITPESFFGQQFRSFGVGNSFAYISDLDAYLLRGELPQRRDSYIASPASTTRSILSCQVRADGAKVGMLIAESQSPDAFTEGHRLALNALSEAAGALYVEYRHRQAMCGGMKPFLRGMNVFNELMHMSRQLRPFDLLYLVYEIDYGAGRIQAHFDKSVIAPKHLLMDSSFGYAFEDSSLASWVVRNRRAKFLASAADDLDSPNGFLSSDGVNAFAIAGPVFATPIRVTGHTSAVLVCWSRLASGDAKFNPGDFEKQCPRISNLASLIANSPDRETDLPAKDRCAYSFILNLNNVLEPVDKNADWNYQQLDDPNFRSDVTRAVLESLLHETTKLTRVRLWLRQDSGKPAVFELVHSVCSPRAMREDCFRHDKYAGRKTTSDDIYCSYTVGRASSEPFAQFQHEDMFGTSDANGDDLEKAVGGSWLVAPIVHKREVIGFLSADDHIDRTQPHSSPMVKEFQRCAMDLAADLLILLQESSTSIVKGHRKQRERKPSYPIAEQARRAKTRRNSESRNSPIVLVKVIGNGKLMA